MSDTPDLAALTPVARRSASYYRDMAIACRRSAAIERAHHSTDSADRLAHARKADDLDAHAEQWEALAIELETFAAERGDDHPDQGVLL